MPKSRFINIAAGDGKHVKILTLAACSSAFRVSLSSPFAIVAKAAAALLDLGLVPPTRPW